MVQVAASKADKQGLQLQLEVERASNAHLARVLREYKLQRRKAQSQVMTCAVINMVASLHA